MKLDFAIISEHVEPSANGQIHFWGAGFESIGSDSFPARYQFFLTVKMRLNEADLARPHQFRLEVTNPVGETKEVYSEPNAKVGPAKTPDRPAYATFMVGLGFLFLNPGEYTFRLFVDGIEVKDWPILLHKRDGLQPGVTGTHAPDVTDEDAIWDEIEKIAPSDEMLIAYAQHRRSTPPF